MKTIKITEDMTGWVKSLRKIIGKPTRKGLKKEISQLNSVINGLNSVLVKKSKEIEAYEQCYRRLMNINIQLIKTINLMDGKNEV